MRFSVTVAVRLDYRDVKPGQYAIPLSMQVEYELPAADFLLAASIQEDYMRLTEEIKKRHGGEKR